MIHDFIGNADSILALNPLFKKAFDYLRSNDLSKMDLGKIVLEEGKLFLTIMQYEGKQPEAVKMESHCKYIDIQYIIDGKEQMGWATLKNCMYPIDGFNLEKDIQFYLDKPTSLLTVEAGEFTVFFPQDVHAPSIGSGTIKKVVVKVLA
jgi:biofilm protein TabA